MRYLCLWGLASIWLLGFVPTAWSQDLNQQLALALLEEAQLQQQMADKAEEIEKLKLAQIIQDLKAIGLPKGPYNDDFVAEHAAMILAYAEEYEQARWVMHMLTPDVSTGNISRTNDFRPDPLIPTGSAVQEDYFLVETLPDGKLQYDGFGFDRGHLAPSADFRWSQLALSESYFYSNMSPQRPRFNRESWAALEDLFRAYVDRHSDTKLYVVTLPILHEGLPVVDRSVNKVAIPAYYAKLALDLTHQRGIAFVMPNRYCDEPLYTFAISIDSLEKLTGLDFFPNLESGLQAKLEAMSDPKPWLPDAQQQDVRPVSVELLPRGYFNTLQAKNHVGTGKSITICGTVVSTKLSGKGNVFLNLDRAFPNQIFTVSIFADKVINFPYAPHEYLKGKQICVTGKITDFQGTASMAIDNAKAIQFFD
ncbi:DNA/RNA non-specific endonuclease [Eisenibacter elegans]|jgi:endonuclease G|uniref:DNA/RNA non-specific endonuclease n=1 Tax=Eisenibacter elegans TaxID=997 RepID=UPI000422F0D4|nr:DNA/RNA non-specific endonuclease [Eisenibacter elegans]